MRLTTPAETLARFRFGAKNDAARSPQAPSSSRRVNQLHLSPKGAALPNSSTEMAAVKLLLAMRVFLGRSSVPVALPGIVVKSAVAAIQHVSPNLNLGPRALDASRKRRHHLDELRSHGGPPIQCHVERTGRMRKTADTDAIDTRPRDVLHSLQGHAARGL